MKISLTFDNGPDPSTTPYVLDVLARNDVAATFFQVGKNLSPATQPLITRILDAGHRIGNHSFTHSIPLGLCDAATAVDEIARTQQALASAGVDTLLFRPFGGGGNLNRELLHPAAWQYLLAHGMTCITWNCVPRDWVDPHHWRERAVGDIQQRDWSVVVLHDLANRGMEHLEGFIADVRALGGTFSQDFPVDCMPMQQGREHWDVAHLMPQAA